MTFSYLCFNVNGFGLIASSQAFWVPFSVPSSCLVHFLARCLSNLPRILSANRMVWQFKSFYGKKKTKQSNYIKSLKNFQLRYSNIYCIEIYTQKDNNLSLPKYVGKKCHSECNYKFERNCLKFISAFPKWKMLSA